MATHFTAEFKPEAAKLLADHAYTFVKTAQAVNVSHSALTRRVNKLRLERQGTAPPRYAAFRHYIGNQKREIQVKPRQVYDGRH